MATSSPRESTTAMLAQIEAEIISATNRGIRCEKWGLTHDAQISWAMQKLEEARNERDAMRTTIEELSEQVKQLSTMLDKRRTPIKESGQNLHVQSSRSLQPVPGTARTEK